MLATGLLKFKAVGLILTAAIASTGTLAGVLLVHHANSNATASIPLPAAPPSPTPTDTASPAVSATPVAAPTPAPVYTPTSPPPAQVQIVTTTTLSDPQIDQLLAPIALYSDPLIAEILPASTYPDELVSAAQWLRYNPSPDTGAIDAQPWEPPIKALAHSPSVLDWMATNADWTRTLGTTFTYQPQQVMNSIQRLRAQAVAAGSLVTTPQQTIVYEDRQICIEPAAADIIYVPVYDWRVCYTRRYAPTFFVGGGIGLWFDNDFDWDHRILTVGARWDRGWDHRWDHDRAARPASVSVRDTDIRNTNINNTTVNNTTINNTTVNNTRTVQVGGTPWQRNQSKPAPTVAASVKPAARAPDRRVQPAPEPKIAPSDTRTPNTRTPDVRTRVQNETPTPAIPETPKATPDTPKVVPVVPPKGPTEIDSGPGRGTPPAPIDSRGRAAQSPSRGPDRGDRGDRGGNDHN